MSKTNSLPMRALQVRLVPIGTLKPYINNARHHSESQLRLIMRSMKEFGFTNPLLIDETGMILCGHGRYEAAVRLGMSEVPTIQLSDIGYGLELDPKYCDVIVRRMEALTGELARMIDGTLFADVARERVASNNGKA